jgi:TRAP-type mannitol/chloroaromatic compound transport system substrate-binding protein
LLAPHSDLAVGLHRVTKFYYGPGFDKPNGTGEALVSTRAYDALPDDLKAIVATACRDEHATALGQAEWMNALALETLTTTHGVEPKQMPADVVARARAIADDLVSEIAAKDPLSGRVVDSWRRARIKTAGWAAANLAHFLPSRIG